MRHGQDSNCGFRFEIDHPGRFDVSGVGLFVLQAGEQLRGDVGSLGCRQRQGFPKKFLRSRGHVAILDAAVQPNKRLHPTAADRRAD